ncbi:folate-binding protein [Maritimibacter sp. UBA3975]|uniref:CAF17-like 4Fe-4S cluster assembly/insertion protein YgfZ n=1 Tax=Maritimibacter sp. UBA3975 TaxID=1946833 RepID=UPI000C0A6FFD|nr:folate-binding protein [Maritimibacter sp. UBA3975]MAM61442.1 folate-binding protein YgfZ [Maritimibacter sp.]|tara:strand:+ start:10244 stop:10993 length:750 start_codon:yes stop_codon:yes gene_type:complete
MTGETHENRTIFRVTGGDRKSFLENLVTNNLTEGALTYAALLTPQGKYIADFFLLDGPDAILVDVDNDVAPALAQKLTMYKLRADVKIEETGLHALRGLGDPPQGAHHDPRHPALGWRLYSETAGDPPETDWEALRVEHGVPATGTELTPDTFILEAGFDRLNGVDFRKGCFVGQEVTARMKHKTELRKGVVTVAIDGDAAAGDPITTEDGKPAGTLHTRAGDHALAYLRFDRATGPLKAGDARVTWTQ